MYRYVSQTMSFYVCRRCADLVVVAAVAKPRVERVAHVGRADLGVFRCCVACVASARSA